MLVQNLNEYFTKESLKELKIELENRLKNDVKESFKDGKFDNCNKWPFQLNIPKFNSLFNISTSDCNTITTSDCNTITTSDCNTITTSDCNTITTSDCSRRLHNEFKNIIKELEALDINDISFRLYPLLRKILIIIEGYVYYSIKKINFENFKLIDQILENDPFSTILDSYYNEHELILSKNILSNLSFDEFSIETVIETFEIISTIIIRSINSNISQNQLLMNFILFNNLQRIFSTFFLYCFSINLSNKLENHFTNHSENHFTNHSENHFTNHLDRIIKLTSLILGNGEIMSRNDENWLNFFLLPIYDILSISFSLFNQFDEQITPLFYSLIDSINTIELFISLDFNRLLHNLSSYLILYIANLKKFLQIANNQFYTIYHQIYPYPHPNTPGNSHPNTPGNRNLHGNSQDSRLNNPQDSRLNNPQDSRLNNPQDSRLNNPQDSRLNNRLDVEYGIRLREDIERDIKNCITEYSKLYNIISSLTSKLTRLPKITSSTNELYNFMENINEIIIHNVRLILILDSIEYITRKKPNMELTGFLKDTLMKSWNLSVLIFNNLPFRIINALFYYIGSSFNNKNILAQIYLYNTIDFKRLNLQDFTLYTKMLQQILINSQDIFTSPITFQNNLNKFKIKYLTIKFSLICQIFLHELCKYNNIKGVVYMFIGWCYSNNPFHQILSQKLCIFIIKLLEINVKYLDICKYILDTILGLCFFNNFDTILHTHTNVHTNTLDSIHTNERDIINNSVNVRDSIKIDNLLDSNKLGQVNFYQMSSFCKLRILSNSSLMPWIIENIVLPYTCAFVSSLKSLIQNLHEHNCNCVICHYKCFFTNISDSTTKKLDSSMINISSNLTSESVDVMGCNCMNSIIINRAPSISHYLELIISLSYNWPIKSNKPNQFILNTINKILNQLINLLINLKGKGTVDMKIVLFTISIKLTKAITNTKDFKLNNTNLPLLIKLSSILGYQEICKGNTTCYMKLLLEIFGILHKILCNDHNEQLFDLHKGLYNSLVGKIQKFPSTLTKLEYYKGKNKELMRTYGMNIKSIIESTKTINSQALRIIYNYRTWKFIKQNYNTESNNQCNKFKNESNNEFNNQSKNESNKFKNELLNNISNMNVTEKSLEKIVDDMIENGLVKRDGIEYIILINLLYIKSIQIKEISKEEKTQQISIY